MEPISGLEPETSSLPRKCSTAELYGQCTLAWPLLSLPILGTPIQIFFTSVHRGQLIPPICHYLVYRPIVGAGDRDRTDIISLEGWGSTIELHPQHTHIMVEGVGFEPT